MTDRRLVPRYPLVLRAEITDQLSSTKFAARTSDISCAGCYLDMLTPLPQGAQIHVRLHKEEEMFESAATVIYVSPGLGMGVAFAANLEANQQVVLDRWLTAAAQTSP